MICNLLADARTRVRRNNNARSIESAAGVYYMETSCICASTQEVAHARTHSVQTVYAASFGAGWVKVAV
jgi:hypothetical protein